MIHFVIGTRAQLFKMTPIMLECQRRGLDWRWIYAAQHKDTFQQTIEYFGIPAADYTIVNWNTEAKTIINMLYWMHRMTIALFRSKVILSEYTGNNHIVLTHGDTTTTVFGALIGKLTGTKVMHIESGLRSFNIFNPFPEELNRIITFRLTNYFACPGQVAMNNVKKLKGIKINTVQNTQIDVLKFGLENTHKATISIPEEKYVVMSVHRFENLYNKERFKTIIEAAELASKFFKVVIPQHPVTEGQITRQNHRNRLEQNANIILLPRLEYENYLKLIIGSEFVMTDGGGNQEELYYLGKPTLILREKTERQEGLGETSVLSNFDPEIIADFFKNYQKHRRPMVERGISPTSIIVNEIEKFG